MRKNDLHMKHSKYFVSRRRKKSVFVCLHEKKNRSKLTTQTIGKLNVNDIGVLFLIPEVKKVIISHVRHTFQSKVESHLGL